MLNYSGARVLITGNTGFCGVWLSSLLHILGAKVYGFSRDSSNFSTLFGPEEIEQKWPTVKGRVEDKIHFQNSVASIAPDLIFHLAAQSLVGRGYKSPFETFESNFNGTLSVLESSLTAPSLKGLVVITTDKVYADSSKLNTENSTLGGIDPYSCSKVAAEYAVTAYRPIFSNKNISLAVVRGGNVIGGGDWSEDRLVPDIVKTFENGTSLGLRNPHAIRPWQHVLDLTYAYALVGWKMFEGVSEESNTVYNVGPEISQNFSVLEIVDLFTKFGLPITTHFAQSQNYESSVLRIDSQKIKSVFNWKNEYVTEVAVEKTAHWYLQAGSSRGRTLPLVTLETEEFLGKKSKFGH